MTAAIQTYQTSSFHRFSSTKKNTSGRRVSSQKNSSSPKAHNSKVRNTKANSQARKRATARVMENRRNALLKSFQKAIFTVLCLSLVIGVYTILESIYLCPTVVRADENLSEIQYKVVQIQYGDSLWSIAKENITPGFDNINDYIDEIITCNQLHSNQINEGCYLMVPYYEVLTSDSYDMNE